MDDFRRLSNMLKCKFPEYKVSVRRSKMPNGDIGDCDKKGKKFVIRIDKFKEESEQFLILVHEFAHVPAWDDPDDHGVMWCKAYAKCYKIYEEFIDKINNENNED